MQIRSDSVDESTRSIEAILATENPVLVFDWSRWEAVDEILLMDGCQLRDQIPLLNDHRKLSLDDVFGSIREIKRNGQELSCRLYFADMKDHKEDPEAQRIERAWTKVKQRHQREVSVGYRIMESTTIPAKESAMVNGRTYTAGSRPLRIATKWLLREGSLTPIAADMAATTRSEDDMNPLLKYLQTIGLRSDATMGEAWQFVANLGDAAQRSEVQRILSESTNLTPSDVARAAMKNWGKAPESQATTASNQTGTNQGEQSPGSRSENVDIAEQVRRATAEAMAAERTRAAEIQRIFRETEVDNPALMARAINDGWDAGRTAQELIPLIRQRQAPLDNTGHVGIHVTRSASLQSLALAMMLRNGACPLDSPALSMPQIQQRFAVRSEDGSIDQTRAGSVLALDINHADRQRAMEDAHRINARGFSLVDLCEMSLRAANQRVPFDREEMVRSAVSSSQVQAVFSTDINARMLQSYALAEDTTMGWVREEDRDDFNMNEGITVGHFNGLTVHRPGKTAEHMDIDAESYLYRLFRYTGQFVIDEMDIINNRFGNLTQMLPEQMGAIARQVRPNLVYSKLLANPTFSGSAVFTVGRGNLFEGATTNMSILQIQAMNAAMAKQRIRNQPLNLKVKYIIAPFELGETLDAIINSTEVRTNDAAQRLYGTTNVLARKGFIPVTDDRLSAAGCVDPESGTSYAGSATNFYTAADPRGGMAKTLVVGYRRGTGRQPTMRSFALTQGRWGIGWDVALDIGCAFEDFRSMQRSKGAV